MKGDLVYIESPYAKSESGTVEDHEEYARLCLLDSMKRGEYPFLSHLLYPQVLDDLEKSERKQGMISGRKWAEYADLIAIYTDQGITKGMEWGINSAKKHGQKVEHRSLYEEQDNDKS